MTDLTPGQCARLSMLGNHDPDRTEVHWRVLHGDRYELQYCVSNKYLFTMWKTLLWSRTHERFLERVKAADFYYKAAVSIHEVLKAGL